MSKGSILIVDDEPNIRLVLQAAFEKAGYKAFVAEDDFRRRAVESKHADFHFRVESRLPWYRELGLLDHSGLWAQGQSWREHRFEVAPPLSFLVLERQGGNADSRGS